MAQMHSIVFNDRIDAGLCAFFLFVVVSILFFSIRTSLAARRNPNPTAREIAAIAIPAE